MMDIPDFKSVDGRMDKLSAYLLHSPILETVNHRVSVNTKLAADILTSDILADVFGNVAAKFHRHYRDVYFDILSRMTAPIITTPIIEVGHTKRFMSFAGVGKSSTEDLSKRIAWEALRQSFNTSGALVTNLDVGDDAPLAHLWPRDPCFIVGQVAFFPDPTLIAAYRGNQDISEYQTVWDNSRRLMEAQGLKIVVVDGCYFEGGNIVADTIGGFLFYGERYDHRSEDMRPLCDSIAAHSGIHLEPVPIPTDTMIYPHLDLGMSPLLPNGKFMVAQSLGPDRNCAGYYKILKYLGEDRIVGIHSKHDAVTTAIANSSVMGNGIMMPYCPSELRQTLEGDGLVVNAPSEQDLAGSIYSFTGVNGIRILSNGGPHCLSNESVCPS